MRMTKDGQSYSYSKSGSKSARPFRKYDKLYREHSRSSSSSQKTTNTLTGSQRHDTYDYSILEREDIIQNDYFQGHSPDLEHDYDHDRDHDRPDQDNWDYETSDRDTRRYPPEPDYYVEDVYESDPGAYSQRGVEGRKGRERSTEHRYAQERWSRSRYGFGGSVDGREQEYWTDRDGDYDASLDAQHPKRGPGRTLEEDEHYQYPESYYVEAPDYYRERYMPEEDALNRLYVRMFKNIEYNIKVPVMQLIATGALFFIFILNYYMNYEYVEALGYFSPWVAVQPPAVAAILGAMFGLFLYLYPTFESDLRRMLIISTIILLIVLFAGPALLVYATSSDIVLVGGAFADSILEFLKLAAVLVYWAPIFLGIYGIWSKNSFFIGTSAMFLFLIIIVLDIYLYYEGTPITKIKANWLQYVIFSIILFCYMEMSDSAITFANYTSIGDKESIDPGYYEHLDRILQKYFVYFVLFSILIIILTWITINFSEILSAFGSTQVAESLEMQTIYGSILSLLAIGIVIIFIALFIRYEKTFHSVYGRITDKLNFQKPYQTAEYGSRRRSAVQRDDETRRVYKHRN